MLNSGIPEIADSRRLEYARAFITLDIFGYLIPSLQAEASKKIDRLDTLGSFTT